MKTLGEELEMVDECLHRFTDARSWWRGHLGILAAVVAQGHLLGALANNTYRLTDLIESNGVAVEVVTVGSHNHVEVDLVVREVGHVAA